MTPEARARQTIDALLTAAGWHVCNVANASIHAALREFPLSALIGFAYFLLGRESIIAKTDGHLLNIREVVAQVDASLQCDRAELQAMLIEPQ